MLSSAYAIFRLKIRDCIKILIPFLYDFDFFEHLNTDIRNYSDFGNMYLVGDLNARTGGESDFVPNLN